MRIAWFGPEPTYGGGVPYVATQILAALPAAGASVDAYVAGVRHDLGRLAAQPGINLIREPVRWEWDRWYSNNSVSAITTGQVARFRAQRRLMELLLAGHRDAPYDVIYQFSQFESPWSRKTGRLLPPVIVHPEVHAAGELRWHRSEVALSRRCEPKYVRAAVRAVLAGRATLQRRNAGAAAAFIAPSSVFARALEHDYGIAAAKLHVVPNPVDLTRFAPPPSARSNPEVLTLLYVSRIAVRKGAELVVALSHRLADLAGAVRLLVIGDKSMFSDYRPLLADLSPAVATYLGPASSSDLADRYRAADIVLQPSHYEPFALTVAEALASGVPVVASDEVGAAEGVHRKACRVFSSGSVDGFEVATRELIDDVRRNGAELRCLARTEAERLFAPGAVATQIVDVCKVVSEAALGYRRVGSPT